MDIGKHTGWYTVDIGHHNMWGYGPVGTFEVCQKGCHSVSCLSPESRDLLSSSQAFVAVSCHRPCWPWGFSGGPTEPTRQEEASGPNVALKNVSLTSRGWRDGFVAETHSKTSAKPIPISWMRGSLIVTGHLVGWVTRCVGVQHSFTLFPVSCHLCQSPLTFKVGHGHAQDRLSEGVCGSRLFCMWGRPKALIHVQLYVHRWNAILQWAHPALLATWPPTHHPRMYGPAKRQGSAGPWTKGAHHGRWVLLYMASPAMYRRTIARFNILSTPSTVSRTVRLVRVGPCPAGVTSKCL